MSRPTILPGLHQIALPTTYAIGDVNAFLAEGDPLTLIDCGMGGEDVHRILDEELAALGYRIADIRRLIISHHHTDHLGLTIEIVEASGAEVWAHPYTAPWLETPQAAQAELIAFANLMYHEAGMPPSVIEILRQSGSAITRLARAVPITRMIDEGDTLTMIDHQWHVYHTPGHAGGMICLYQPETRVLLSSDHLLLKISSNPLLEPPLSHGGERPKRLLDYMSELRRIAALDIAVAYTGHGDPIDDVRGLIASRLEFHHKRSEKLYGMFAGQPRNLYELTQMMFPKVQGPEIFLTLSEVLGHIDILECDGRLSRQRKDGVVYWQTIAAPSWAI